MQSSGTAEGLRSLIDMSLLKSIKKIVAYRGLFGPSVFPLGLLDIIRLVSVLTPSCSNQYHVVVRAQRTNFSSHYTGNRLACNVLPSRREWHRTSD